MAQAFVTFRDEYLAMDKTTTSCNTLWTMIKDKILDLVREYVPSKQIKARFHVPWIDDEIRRLMRRREKLRSRTKHRRWDAQVGARAKELKR